MGKITPNTHTHTHRDTQSLSNTPEKARKRERDKPEIPLFQKKMSSLFFFLLARKWLICISTHKHTTRQLEQHYSVKVAKVVPTPPNNTVYNMYRNKRRLSQWAEKPYTSRWITYTNINTLIILENEAESLRHRICAEEKIINKLFQAISTSNTPITLF